MAINPSGLVMPQHQAIEKSDVFPADVTPRLFGDQNHPALFSYVTDDIISMVADAPSPLSTWLPARGVTWWNEPIAHLTWIAPTGFDGSQSYEEFLADQPEIEECDFGDGFKYQICEYAHTMGRVSWSTKDEPIKTETLGVRLWQNMPQQILRGPNAGLVISNDRDWSLARLGIGAQEHQNWNIIKGSRAAYSNTYDGVNEIVQTGWVKNHSFGVGDCVFTDPIVENGISLVTNEEIIRKIKRTYLKLKKRHTSRGYQPRMGDIVILMNDTMWSYLSETLAFGVMSIFNAPSSMVINTTPQIVRDELNRIRQGGLGFGFMDIDGDLVPVLPEQRIGSAKTINGEYAVTGDIFILSRYFHGITVLEHQYLDWGQINVARPLPQLESLTGGYMPQFFQNNMIRVSTLPVTGNWQCWYYGAEMYGRIVSYMNSLQARINDVTVLVDQAGENESASFTSPDFYAFEGTQGGAGTAILEPL